MIDWDAIVGAGLARAPGGRIAVPREEIDSIPGGPRQIEVIPFGGRLVDRLNRFGATHRALLLAYDTRRSFQVFLPVDDPGTQRLVAELRARLGERWLDGDWELMELRKRLGIRLGLRSGGLAVAFVVVVAIGGMLAVAGWAGLVAAWGQGDFSLLQPYTLVPLALWCAFAWYALRRLRS